MESDTFEGTLVLEQLAAIGKLDEFYEAIDGDDFRTARNLMKLANIDPDTITIVLQKMAAGDGEH